ncbi:sensor histidine kinase [Streptacidiphilus jiangxiensis]|uniref:Signal transduction histidine kinase n=1 Tax=Streptacidiphilus jiangxiensis TaxID=235985 RepID=A0A1H7RPS0_STRJI|nr:ATP-binding protein [Streptacidiphilus jiangxiensis]SEL61377.1 Signal transduction histidine kinase [Streptacidiphilus jiangxiensis]
MRLREVSAAGGGTSARVRALVARTVRELGAPLHLGTLGLLALILLHGTILDPGRARAATIGLSLAFAAVYGLAPEVARRVDADVRAWNPAPRVVAEAGLWLVALTALWLSLTALRMEFDLLVVPLYFVYLLMLPAPPWLAVGGLTTGALVMRLVVHQPPYPLATLGLVVGASLALWLARCLSQIRMLRTRDRILIAELRRVCEEQRQEEREAGRAEERGRLAQDVHDTVAQGLSAMAMLLKAADEAMPPVADLDRARTRLRAAAEINSVALGQARDMVHGIAFSELGEGGLPSAVDRYVTLVQRTLLVREAMQEVGQRLVYTLRGEPFRLPIATESAMLRVIQEAVNNALRHGWATQVEVVLSYGAERLNVEVRDNGVGLPPGIVAGADRPESAERGVGLDAMRERVERVGGAFELISRVGRGTIIAVELPPPAGPARLTA